MIDAVYFIMFVYCLTWTVGLFFFVSVVVSSCVVALLRCLLGNNNGLVCQGKFVVVSHIYPASCVK